MANGLTRALSILVHADTKIGKSTLGNTTPTPRLLLDAEAAHRFLVGKQVFWDPMTEAPPEPGRGRTGAKLTDPVEDIEWETCVVVVREYQILIRAYEWLNAGRHSFKSVTIDSISEVQKKLKDTVKSLDEEMNFKKWGLLLDHMEKLVRDFRDLTEHPTQPLEAVVLTAMTTNKDGKWRPYVQGSLATTMPYFLDVIGYMFVQEIPNADPTQPPAKVRQMLVAPHPMYEAGERVNGKLGDYVTNPTVKQMLDTIFGTQGESE